MIQTVAGATPAAGLDLSWLLFDEDEDAAATVDFVVVVFAITKDVTSVSTDSCSGGRGGNCVFVVLVSEFVRVLSAEATVRNPFFL